MLESLLHIYLYHTLLKNVGTKVHICSARPLNSFNLSLFFYSQIGLKIKSKLETTRRCDTNPRRIRNRVGFNEECLKKDDIYRPFLGRLSWYSDLFSISIVVSQFADLITRGCEKLSPNILTSEWTTMKMGHPVVLGMMSGFLLLKVKLRRENATGWN